MNNPSTKNIFIIAEIGQAHDGSLGILHSYIDAVSKTGVDAIKFQTHIAQAESSPHEPFRVNFSYEDTTRFDYWHRVSFSQDQWNEIKRHCDEKNIEFMSSPFSNQAVELLEQVGIKRYKVGSGELSNPLLLERIATTQKPIILSSGMSDFNALDSSVNLLKKFGNPLTLMQCTTCYPTPPEQVGLNVLSELKKRYNLPVGLSDHSGQPYASLAAVALGACCIEVHTVFDKRMFGPDSSSSLEIDTLTELVNGIRTIQTMLNHPVDKKDSQSFETLRTMFGKSLSVNKDLPKGHRLTIEDLEGKKPAGYGLPAQAFRQLLGQPLQRDKKCWDFLQKDDIP